ncbi:MAG: methyltransferase domain-containing protein [Candidatus Aegiribacteria sp.]|nr:methyltransferase domain-containing protein [Candidatus Aegiribacteria sp.]MBD3294017.1 methyltransferase domain-containing protein [Candidatus Fermentibacteria bacterium]
MTARTAVLPSRDHVIRSFSRAAGEYDRHALHHRAIASRLMNLMPSIEVMESILEIGCGTGILTGKLLNRFPEASVTALDISPDMVMQCRKRLKDSAGISFRVMDGESLCQIRRKYHLVASSCAVQWFRDRERVPDLFREVLKRNGLVLTAIPVQGTFSELEESFRRGAAFSMNGLKLESGEYWHRRFSSAGFKILFSRVEDVAVLYETPIDVLKGIRGIGAVLRSGRKCVDPGRIGAMSRYYRRVFSDHCGDVTCTYSVHYFCGRKV